MEPPLVLNIILAIAIISYVFDQLLDYVNIKSMRRDIPDNVAEFYNRDRYMRSLDYHQELTRFSFISSGFSFIIMIVMLVSGGFGWLDDLLRGYIQQPVLLALVFFAILALASDVLSLPFQLY